MWSHQLKHAMPTRLETEDGGGDQIWPMVSLAHTIRRAMRLALTTGREAVIESDLPPSSMALLCMSLTLSLVIQLIGCIPPNRLSYAQTNSVEISETGQTYEVHSFNEAGDEVDCFVQPSSYIDSESNVYRCVNPHIAFTEGSFTQEEVCPFDDATVKRCALAEKWCKDTIDRDKASIISQLFIWKIIATTNIYEDIDQDGIVNWTVDGLDIDRRFAEFESWYAQNEQGFEGTGMYWASDAHAQDVMSFSIEPKVINGSLSIHKTSTHTELSTNNGIYTLEGAHYSIWKDEACNIRAIETELVTGKDGTSNSIELPSGTYYVKESVAPVAYRLSEHVYPAIIEADKPTRIEVQDDPVYQEVDVWARKVASNPTGNTPHPLPLAGCKVCITYYDRYFEGDVIPDNTTPIRTWVLDSDESGDFRVPESSKNLFFQIDGKVVCPLGTIAVQETAAPEGYWLEGQTGLEVDGYEAPEHVVAVRKEGDFVAPLIVDDIFRAGIEVHKEDTQTTGTPQGDATFSGITFEVINQSGHNVQVGNASYAPGEVVTTLTTNEKGEAKSPENYFPTGTYAIHESSSNSSYLIDKSKELTVTIEPKDAGKHVFAGTIKDNVVRGGIRVGKVSRETSSRTPQGAATLAGAQLELTLMSNHPVKVDGSTIQPNCIICILETNDQGICETPADYLPYGTYRIREIAEPRGYEINKDWSTTVEIRENGKIVDLTDSQRALPEQVKRGSLTFTKIDKETGQALAGIPFLIESTTTKEHHIAVTDEKGVLDTESVPHTTLTNANDVALGIGGLADETKLNPKAGIWFAGGSDTPTQPVDTKGALPYDTYHIQELRVTANEDKILQEFDVILQKEDIDINYGTVENERMLKPDISTVLTLVEATPGTRYVFEDAVIYEDLTPGKTYTLVGTLVNKDAASFGDTPKSLATATCDFTPRESTGTEIVRFTYEGNLSGMTVVAFETLQDAGKNVVCDHSDLEDTLQTTHVPSIGTMLADAHGHKDVSVAENGCTLVDTVSCANLESGVWYTLKGTLVYKETKEQVKDAHGDPIMAHADFEAKGPNDTIEVTFVIHDPASIVGSTIVAFEELYLDDVRVATHADINDEAQTISIPVIISELTDETGSHIVPCTSRVTLTDTVYYAGLTPGVTYEVFGSLVDRKTAEAVRNTQNISTSSHVSFTPRDTAGTERVTFEIDTSTLGGRELVAFESIVRDGVEVARHADLEDKLQTVSIPSISTELTDTSGSHRTKATDSLTLNDTVSYAGLEPNKTYTVVGTLMNSSTGKQVTGKDGKLIETTQQFTAVTGGSKVTVPFTFDASDLGGTTVVACETIREGAGTTGREIAAHTDLKCEYQTVVLTANDSVTDPSIVANSTPTTTTPTDTPLTPASTPTATTGASTGAIQGASTSTPYSGSTGTITSAALPHTYDATRAPAALLITGVAIVGMSIGVRVHLYHLVHIKRRRARHFKTQL